EVATRGVPYQPEMNWQWNGNEAPASLPGSLLGPVEGGSASNNLWDVEVLAQALQVLQGQHDTHQPTLGTVGPQLDNAYTVMPQEAQSGYSLHNSLSGNLGWPAPNHFMSDTTGHPAERELRAAQQLQQLTSTPEEFLLLERITGDGFAATQVLAPLLQHRRELMVSGPPAMLSRVPAASLAGGFCELCRPAGADWNPRAAAQAAISGATGTGVFLPRLPPQPSAPPNAAPTSSTRFSTKEGAAPASSSSSSTPHVDSVPPPLPPTASLPPTLSQLAATATHAAAAPTAPTPTPTPASSSAG
ncbi:hypothetical protein HaLaN_24369, partial [Haematococcus lacustris]